MLLKEVLGAAGPANIVQHFCVWLFGNKISIVSLLLMCWVLSPVHINEWMVQKCSLRHKCVKNSNKNTRIHNNIFKYKR